MHFSFLPLQNVRAEYPQFVKLVETYDPANEYVVAIVMKHNRFKGSGTHFVVTRPTAPANPDRLTDVHVLPTGAEWSAV